MKTKSLLFFLLLISVYANAQYGLDPAFGNGGTVISQYGLCDSASHFSDVTLQQDGKIIAVGGAGGCSTSDVILQRLNTDGTSDNTFAAGGVFRYAANGLTPQRVLVQPDGKILVCGDTLNPVTLSDYCVFRLNANGSIDSSFGNSGFVSTNISGPTVFRDYSEAMVLQPDGKIIVAGTSSDAFSIFQNFSMVRYLPDGTRDSAFGNNGMVATLAAFTTACHSMALQADGKILLAGTTDNGSGYNNVLVFRYHANGSLDSSFGYNGQLNWELGTASAHDIKVLSNGKILVAGANVILTIPPYNYQHFIARFQANGNIDSSFHGNGYVRIAYNHLDAELFYKDRKAHMAVMPDGRIVLAGTATDSNNIKYCTLARCQANGSIDSSFATNGRQVMTIDTPGSYTGGMVLQPDDKIVTAGAAAYMTGAASLPSLTYVARFLPGGSLAVPSVSLLQPLVIYPNPVSDQLYINDYDPLRFGPAQQISITDAVGHGCYFEYAPNLKKGISCSHLPTGIYLFTIKGSNHTFQAKFLKE